MAPINNTISPQQPLSERLKTDSYYWKLEEENERIRYAFFHMDEVPSYTFLILFDSSEANKYEIYHTLNEPGNNRSNSKKIILDFIEEVEEFFHNEEKNSKRWSRCKRPDMVVSNHLEEIVEQTIIMMNQKKKQNEKVHKDRNTSREAK